MGADRRRLAMPLELVPMPDEGELVLASAFPAGRVIAGFVGRTLRDRRRS